MKNKLLITTPYFYPHSGGLENYAYKIARGLIKSKKWEVVVVTSNYKNKKYKVENIEGIKIYRMPLVLRISNTPINPLWYFKLKEIIKAEKPDIINAHAPVPFMIDMTSLTVGRGTPYVITYHSGSMKKGNIFLDPFLWFYEKFILKFSIHKANGIICTSNFVKEVMFKNISKKRVVINPGVNTDLFKPSKTGKKDNSVLFVARYANMHKLKGFYFLSEAVNKISGLTLKVIGEKGKIKATNIKYLGILTEKETALEMQKSKIVILPTARNIEGFGMVLIEAMACAVPVIGTKITGIMDVIDNKVNGLTVPPKDSNALAKAINDILNDERFADKLGENGYKKVREKYVWQLSVKKTNELLLSLLK